MTGAGQDIDRNIGNMEIPVEIGPLKISFLRLDFNENAINPGTMPPHNNEQLLSLFLMLGRSSFIWQCRICTDFRGLDYNARLTSLDYNARLTLLDYFAGLTSRRSALFTRKF